MIPMGDIRCPTAPEGQEGHKFQTPLPAVVVFRGQARIWGPQHPKTPLLGGGANPKLALSKNTTGVKMK